MPNASSFLWREKDVEPKNFGLITAPAWLTLPPPTHRSLDFRQGIKHSNSRDENDGTSKKRAFHIAAMEPIPHTRHHKMLLLSGFSEAQRFEGDQLKIKFPVGSTKHTPVNPPAASRKSSSSSYQAQQLISLNPHGCGRGVIHVCSEEGFLRDVMQFIIHRGHTRLVPQGSFSRGSFHVGNGINWKGQVFSKTCNYTLTNRMTLGWHSSLLLEAGRSVSYAIELHDMSV